MSTASQSADDDNRAVYAGPSVTADLAATGGAELASWSDPGEQAALAAAADDARGGRILDLGVGGGRTTTFLRLVSDRYTGLDYTPAMVAAAQVRHPGVDIRGGDARDLHEFENAGVDLVVFSYNGIDSVDHDDRARVLSEVARVLRPGGLFQFSTFNLEGPNFRASPLRPAGSQLAPTWTPMYRIAMRVLWLLRAPIAVPRAIRNRRAGLRHFSSGDGWAVAPTEAYDFGLVVHYATLAHVRRELADVGLELVAAFDAEYGRPITESTALGHTRYFQLLARRTG